MYRLDTCLTKKDSPDMPTDPALAAANKSVTSAAASPFVVAIKNAGIKGLPSVINGAICKFLFHAYLINSVLTDCSP